MKAVLILVDGMRPDKLTCIPQAREMMERSSCDLQAQTVFPSVTLPCHMSLFHSVPPQRHGTLTNIYMPQVRPVSGLCERLSQNGKRCAFFYNWAELRDLTRPGSLMYSCYCSMHDKGFEYANRLMTKEAIKYIAENEPDFLFLYLGWVDEAGHGNGWLSEEYMRAVRGSWEDIDTLVRSLPEDYVVFVTADHGGHERMHGEDIPEDMTIPVIVQGGPFGPDHPIRDVNIMDIAPTIAKLLDTAPANEWEGKSLF